MEGRKLEDCFEIKRIQNKKLPDAAGTVSAVPDLRASAARCMEVGLPEVCMPEDVANAPRTASLAPGIKIRKISSNLKLKLAVNRC